MQQQQQTEIVQQNPQTTIKIEIPFDPWRRVYSPFVAEFVASLLFTLFSDLLGVLLVEGSGDAFLFVALLEGALTLALICAFRPISGAHFNPASTIASLLTLGTPLLLGLSLLLAQLFGAFFGALLFHSSVSSSVFLDIANRLGTLRSSMLENVVRTTESTGMLTAGGTELLLDGAGRPSPFGGRFQVFFGECLFSTLVVLAFLFTSSPVQSTIRNALAVSTSRSVVSAISSRSPISQSANLARALANALIAQTFTRAAEELAVWRFFYIHFFGAICSAIVCAAIFWLIKCATNQQEQQQQHSRVVHQQQNQGE